MNFAAFLYFLLEAAAPINAAPDLVAPPRHDFTFDLPSIFPGGANPTVSFHLNLTGIDKNTFTGHNVAQVSLQNHAVMDAVEKQIPAYLDNYRDTIKLAGQSCNLQCCENACYALLFIPFATVICIKICEASYEP